MNPLELRLKKLLFSPKQRKFLELYSATNAFQGLSAAEAAKQLFGDVKQASWSFWAEIYKGCLPQVAQKISRIVALNEHERNILYQIDPELRKVVNNLPESVTQLLLSQKVNINKLRNMTGRRWSRRRYTGNPLEDKLISLQLSGIERESVEVSLGWRGEFSGFFQYVRSKFPEIAKDVKRVRIYHQTLRNYRRHALVKIQGAFELEPVYRDMLLKFDEFYSKLMQAYGTFEEAKSAVRNFGANSGGFGAIDFTKHFEGVPADKLLGALEVLRPKDQEAAKSMLGLEGRQALTITEHATQVDVGYGIAYTRFHNVEKRLKAVLSGGEAYKPRCGGRSGGRPRLNRIREPRPARVRNPRIALTMRSQFEEIPDDKLQKALELLKPKFKQRAELMLGLSGGEPLTISQYAASRGISYGLAHETFKTTQRQIKTALLGKAPKAKQKYTGPRSLNSLTIYRAEILKIPEMTEQEIVTLLPHMKAGNVPVQEGVFRSSLRYVLPIAYCFTWHKKTVEKGFSLVDLVQEGNIGLLKAVRNCRYEPNNGSYKSWMNYARASAKYAIMSAFAGSSDSHLIQISAHRQQQVRKYVKARQQLLESLGREPKLGEVAQKMGVGLEVATDVEAAMRVYCTWTVSLDAPLSPSDDSPDPLKWQDVIAASEQNWHTPDNPIKKITERWVREHLSGLLTEILHPVEQFVLRLSFGFEDGSDWEDDNIALEIGVSEKEVRVIRELGIQKLKAHPDALKWMKLLVVT